jgi:hypothetical protein
MDVNCFFRLKSKIQIKAQKIKRTQKPSEIRESREKTQKERLSTQKRFKIMVREKDLQTPCFACRVY